MGLNLFTMDYNWLKILFLFLIFTLVIVASLVNWVENHIPNYLKQSFNYSKFGNNVKSVQPGKHIKFFMKPVELPKRWFSHFYLFAAAYSAFIVVVATNLYFFKSSLEPWMILCLDFVASSQRSANSTVASSYIALILLTLQCWRRFYETWFVSVFSNGRINLAHYLVGYLHYFGAITTIIAEAPGFVYRKEKGDMSFDIYEVTSSDVTGALLFLWACYNQYKCTLLLAGFRKNSKGEVISHNHVMPKGGWFIFVSCPHYLAEVIMYLGLTLILKESKTWRLVFCWVLFNQIEMALLTHWWYKKKFKGYPRKRKAIIPYVL